MSVAERRERFTDLLDDHKKIVYKVCNAYCAGREDRDDLAQEIVTQLWRSFGTFDERLRFSTWMYRVALNVAISFSRRERSRARHLAPEGEALLETRTADDMPSPEVLMLHRFIERLEPLERALVLLYLDGYGYREIAGVLGISETNVGTKIGRLKQSIRREFNAPETA